ncbi:MAG: hypothetical protein J5716_07180 [Alphaproteobacteria bacterium]|nr:hypothetical protein [Alphaproteobacteria bacterium]
MKKIITALCLTSVLSACGTTGDGSSRMLAAVKGNDYPAALKVTQEEKFYESEANQLLKALDIGTMKYLNKDYAGALASFEQAKKISLDKRTASVSKGAAAHVVGEGVADYAGESYETSMLRFMIALTNYHLHMAEPDNTKYADGLLATAKDWNAFVNNAEEVYLDMMQKSWTAVVSPEKTERMYADMNKIFKEAYSTLDSLKKDSPNAQAFQAFTAEAGLNANVNIIFKQGLIQPKTAKKIALPLGKLVSDPLYKILVGNDGILFELTTMEKPSAAQGFDLTIKNEAGKVVQNKKMALISPLSELAYKHFQESEKKRLAVKSARLLVKYTSAFAAGKVAYNKATNVPATFKNSAAVAAFKGATKVIAETEYADTRYWELLPANIYQQKAELKNGKYTLELLQNGKTVHSQSIEIKNDKPIVIDITLPNV